MDNSITTILQVYRRPQYLKEQLNAILNQTVTSDKIIIIHNEGGINFEYPENVHIIKSSENMKYHLRFAIGLLAKTKYVSFYDDDTLPGVNWHKNCIDTIEQQDCICGGSGRIVDLNKRTWYCAGWGQPSDNIVDVDLVGHAWFLKTQHLKYMWSDDIHNFDNGEDIMLSANAKIFGNVKTVVPPHPSSDHTKWSSLKGIEYGADSVASYLTNPIHFEERFALIEKYVQLGWKLVYNG